MRKGIGLSLASVAVKQIVPEASGAPAFWMFVAVTVVMFCAKADAEASRMRKKCLAIEKSNPRSEHPFGCAQVRLRSRRQPQVHEELSVTFAVCLRDPALRDSLL